MILNKKNYQINHRHQLIYIDHHRLQVNIVMKVNTTSNRSTDPYGNKNDYQRRQFNLKNKDKIRKRNHWIQK